jgi:hypothetical protein
VRKRYYSIHRPLHHTDVLGNVNEKVIVLTTHSRSHRGGGGTPVPAWPLPSHPSSVQRPNEHLSLSLTSCEVNVCIHIDWNQVLQHDVHPLLRRPAPHPRSCRYTCDGRSFSSQRDANRPAKSQHGVQTPRTEANHSPHAAEFSPYQPIRLLDVMLEAAATSDRATVTTRNDTSRHDAGFTFIQGTDIYQLTTTSRFPSY